MPKPKRKYTDRSRSVDTQRCARLRWWGYQAGPAKRGLAPKRKSIHLVLGGAVHEGLAVLLEESEKRIALMTGTREEKIVALFAAPTQWIRGIEDQAAAVALAALAEMAEHGVEVDLLEQEAGQPPQQQAAAVPIVQTTSGQSLTEDLKSSLALEDAPIVVEFADSPTEYAVIPDSWTTVINAPQAAGDATADEWLIGMSTELKDALTKTAIEPTNTTGMDKYLREELAALVEAMVRAYSRRRLRPLLEQYEVLEVECEGWWKLSEWLEDTYVTQPYCQVHGWTEVWPHTRYCKQCLPKSFPAVDRGDPKVEFREVDNGERELWFMSRPDALLRDRTTNQLYLLSYKTTGSWDRRKELDAEVDTQGLSEAVDVENRLREAWERLSVDPEGDVSKVSELVNERTAYWMTTLPEPPRILGVRYEHLLKGARRKDKKDPEQPGRYVADTPLVRAWKQDGVTVEDDRWAWTYDWHDALGKSRRLDYRSWRKTPVWRTMTVAGWIDLLDRGEAQEGIYDEQGQPLDCLSEQFHTPIMAYRNEDSYRDMLESLEAQEVRVAQDAEVVHAAEPELQRSELNRRFPQNRSSCAYPQKCWAWSLCHGPQPIRQDPLGSGLYVIRTPNHPIENNCD